MSAYAAIDNIAGRIDERLSGEQRSLLLAAAESAAKRGGRAFLVGGVVRDLLLGAGGLDLDVMVEGDARETARELAAALSGTVTTHDRFLTATVSVGAVRIDFATARKERYARPGALPTVRPADLDADLARRDFTVNAMAASLDPQRFGDLIDPHGGRADLDAGLIRVLHERSFIDDATRILRACRYAARFGFTLEDETERLARETTGRLHAISGSRVRHEIERTLEEAAPGAAFDLAERLGALAAIHPGFRLGPATTRALDAAAGGGGTLGFAILGAALSEETAAALAKRLAVRAGIRRAMTDAARLASRREALAAPALRNSEVYAALSPYVREAVLACRFTAGDGIMAERIDDFTGRLADVRPVLSGDDVIALGVESGPRVGQLLAGLLRARLDGEVETKQDEIEAVRAWRQEPAEGRDDD